MTASASEHEPDRGPVLDDSTRPPALKPFVKRLKLKNFKSIESCDVEFGPLTFLIGRNGSGKSNVLDALKFVGDCFGPEGSSGAFHDRGRRAEILQRKPDGPESFEIGLELNLPSGRSALYSLTCGPDRPTDGSDRVNQFVDWRIRRERLEIHEGKNEEQSPSSYFEVVVDEVEKHSWSDELRMPKGLDDRPYLTIASILPEFREIQDALRTLTFYDFDVKSLKALNMSPSREPLSSSGEGIAGVLARLQKNQPEAKKRFEGYLTTIVPDFESVEIKEYDPEFFYLEFHQGVVKPYEDQENGKVRLRYKIDPATRRDFLAAGMSDGTLRALGVLTAAFQAADKTVPVRLVCIEEPEIAVHPAAAAGLVGALEEASHAHTQIIATTQSADVLDGIDDELLGTDVRLLAVEMIDGITYVGPIDQASRESIRAGLGTPGELLRTDYIEVDLAVKSSKSMSHWSLIAKPEESSRTPLVPEAAETSR